MYKATGEDYFKDKAVGFFNEFGLEYTYLWGFSWETKVLGAHILLHDITGEDKYRNLVDSAINYYLYEAPYTPQGLMFISDWGSLRASTNVWFALLQVRACKGSPKITGYISYPSFTFRLQRTASRPMQ